MITQKYNKQFTEVELNAYLSTIKNIQGGQSAQVDEAWRTLGYINASAYKGYGALSDEHAIYNGMVYRTKEQAILTLAEHTDNIAAFGGVLYIRTLDGIQISFHLGTMSHSSSMLGLLHRQYQTKVEWDGVQNSYTYTDINAYNEARAEYQRKRQEDADKKKYIDSLIHAEVQKFFAHHSTRKAYGLPTKKAEWNEVCSWATSLSPTAYPEAIIRYYGIENYGMNCMVARQIEKNLPEGWNKYNFND